MNPALLQDPYSRRYPSNARYRYFTQQNRRRSRLAPLTPNELVHFPADQQDALTGASQSLSTVNPGLDFNTPVAVTGSSYNPHASTHHSPPSANIAADYSVASDTGYFASHDESHLLVSDAGPADEYQAVGASFASLPWSGTMMAGNNPREHQYAAHSHANVHRFSGPGPMNDPYLPQGHRAGDGYQSGYHGGRMTEPIYPTENVLRGDAFMPHSYAPGAARLAPAAPPAASTPIESPPFEETRFVRTLCTSDGTEVVPDINATILKGFFKVDQKWTCYRRNYFTVACSFFFTRGTPHGDVFLRRPGQTPELVRQYAVSISAQTAHASNQSSEDRNLVQHTPKRDKATETVPGRHLVQPAPHPSHGHTTSGYEAPGPFSNPSFGAPGPGSTYDNYGGHGHHALPYSYTFERIQFQKATANNGKRRAQQQYFQLVVELSVNIGAPGGENEWVLVADKQSDQMVVRGRSPGHYKDNVRRHDRHNMDPDRSSGAGGSGGHAGQFTLTPLLGPQATAMGWAPSTRGHGSYYPSAYSFGRHLEDSSRLLTRLGRQDLGRRRRYSDLTLSASVQSSPPLSLEPPILSPPVTDRWTSVLPDHRRAQEHVCSAEDLCFMGSSSRGDTPSPPPCDYSVTPTARVLCAS